MALLQKERSEAKEVHQATPVSKFPSETDADAQEEQLWEAAIGSSIDVIREMAAKARAERQAGRTKKISL